MAARTASVSGNWADTATWGGSAAPGNGDTAIINDGITVTIPLGTSVTVGASPADDVSTAAIACASSSGTGILLVNGTLTIRGTVQQANATWQFGPAAALIHDSSAAVGTPSYTWRIGMAANQANSKLLFNGASGSVCTVTNAASSGRFGGFHNGATGRNGTRSPTGAGVASAGRFEATFTDFTSVGGTTTEAFDANLGGTTTAPTFKLHDCILDDCGAIIIFAAKGDAVFSLKRTSIKNPVQTNGKAISHSLPLAKTTGTREYEDCIIEGEADLVTTAGANADSGFTALRTAFAGTTGFTPIDKDGGNGQKMDMTDCLVVNRKSAQGGGSYMPAGTHTRLSCWRYNAGGDDDMWRFTIALGLPVTIEGAVFSHEGTATGGEFCTPEGVFGSTVAVISRNVITCPNSDGATPGCQWGEVISTNLRLTIERSTHCGSGNNAGELVRLETVTGGANTIVAVRDSIVWRASSGALVVVGDAGSTLDDNSINFAGNNNIWNASGDPYNPADAKFGSVPGSGDFTTDPQFVDKTRTAMTWASNVSGGSVTTMAGAWAEIRKKNDRSGFNSAYLWYTTSTGFYDWTREGYRPQNVANATSAHDGSYVGAVAYQAPASTGNGGRLRSRLRLRIAA